LVAQENISLDKRNELALELGAASFSNIGAKQRALDFYEDLALINDKVETHFQVAQLQVDIKRFTEATTTINFLMTKKGIETSKLIYPKLDKSSQEVSMKAALMNLKGLIAEANGDNSKATEEFLAALKEEPSFEVAQLNIKRVRGTNKE